MSGKTSVLVLAANPKDTPALRLDQEVREIQIGLLRSRRKGFHIRQDWAVRPRDIRRALLEHRPSIVHFCGHGSGEEGLILEDDHGTSQPVSSSAVAGLFSLFSNQIKCVVLNACFSESQARAIASHVEHVVGMSREIEDRAAIEFAMGFYDAVAAGETYESAFHFGCNAIELAGLRGQHTPILMCKGSALPLVGEPTPSVSATTATEQTRSARGDLSVKSLNDLYAAGWGVIDVMRRLEQIDYDNVAGLDKSSAGDYEQWATIAENNPDGYSFIVDGAGQVVGYWHFEALPEELFTKALCGELEDSEISIDNVILPCTPGELDLYFIIFAIERNFRGFKANRLLLGALLDRLEEFAQAGIHIRKICANAFTPEGVGMCKSLGMSYRQQHRRMGLIFQVAQADLNGLSRTRPHIVKGAKRPSL
ncbi:MAG TPA: CHAT domain-containing protein [Candidatus Dormibacteraeota bacterium]|jgi:hypothetical protein|nr:CHAT domain-containing protein [Candidatus Dormibacteraeota bacterium]